MLVKKKKRKEMKILKEPNLAKNSRKRKDTWLVRESIGTGTNKEQCPKKWGNPRPLALATGSRTITSDQGDRVQ